MASSIWLPSLNSLNQYKNKTYVKASQFGPAEYDESEFFPQFLIELRVSVKLISDNKFSYQRGFEVVSMEDEVFMFCHEVNSKSMTSLRIIEKTIYRNGFISFDIRQAIWKERHLNGSSSKDEAKSCCCLSDKRDLLEKIREFLCLMKLKNQNANKNILPLKIEIEKMVIISDEEVKAWNSWYDQMKRRDPNFERDFREALRRPRREDECTCACDSETTLASRGELGTAAEHDDSSSRISCAICLEELNVGSQVTGLPCSHVFHGDCIVQWLQQSQRCPLCRFVLPQD